MASLYSSGDYFNVGSAPTGDATLNALISGTKWGTSGLGWGANVTFSFPTSFSYNSVSWFGTGAFNYHGAPDTGQALSWTQQNAARDALQKWANVANLHFTEIADQPDTDFFGDNSSVGDIRFGMSNDPGTAYAWYPGSGNSAYGGDVWFNKSDYNNPVVGNYAFDTFMHEIGHALGLEHPHENDDGDTMGSSTDAVKYTIMSYRDYVGDGLNGYSMSDYPTTPMLYDVLAIQRLYGANWSYHSGNDTYSWAPGAKIFETIWDGGGVDTLSAANQTQSVSLHLTSGVYNTIGSTIWDGHANVRDNLVIAYNATIENATGSAYDDTIVGNTVGNVLSGGDGNDYIYGAEWYDSGVYDNDTLRGGNGNDYLAGYNGADSIYGDAGSDTLVGGDGDDYMVGGNNETVWGPIFTPLATAASAIAVKDLVISPILLPISWADVSTDYMYGGDGNDTMYGGAGNDYMYGDNGNDSVYGQNGDDYMVGGEGSDLLDGGTGADTAYGGNGNDTIWGAVSTVTTDLGDFLYGEGGNDVIGGSYGNDTIDGGTGDDSLYGDEGNDVVRGGDGNDYLRGDWGWGSDLSGADTLDGGNGDDTMYGGAGDDVLIGGAGNDYMNGMSGTDTASYSSAPAGVTVDLNIVVAQNTGGAGIDTLVSIENLTGSSYNDTLTGNAVANRINAGSGNDLVLAGDGNDTVDGGAGNDVIRGEGGNDTLVGGLGDDLLDGGAGTDVVSYAAATGAVKVNLATSTATGAAGTDTLVALENVNGSNYGDSIVGNSGNNVLNGGAGNDTIGGGTGNDILIGGTGSDTMSGQGGADMFRWTATAFNSSDVTFGGLDKVTDFNGNDALDFSSAFESLLKVNGTVLGSSAANVVLGNAFNATTNVCLKGSELCIDLDNSGSFTANDFHVQLVGAVASLTYDAAADTFHI